MDFARLASFAELTGFPTLNDFMEPHLSHMGEGETEKGPVRMGGPLHTERRRGGEWYTLIPLMKSISTFSPSKKPLALSRVSNRYLVTEPDLAGT